MSVTRSWNCGGPGACARSSEPVAAVKDGRPALRSRASTCRPPRKYLLLVLGGRGMLEKKQSGQVHPPRAEHIQDHRHAPCGAGDIDPAAGHVLGEPELAHAEGEHRGERPIEVELPLVDLCEMDEKLHLQAVRSPHELARSGTEVRRVERLDNHS